MLTYHVRTYSLVSHLLICELPGSRRSSLVSEAYARSFERIVGGGARLERAVFVAALSQAWQQATDDTSSTWAEGPPLDAEAFARLAAGDRRLMTAR